MKIDLSKLPEGTKWIAIDSDGEVCAFASEPSASIYGAVTVYEDREGACLDHIGYVHD